MTRNRSQAKQSWNIGDIFLVELSDSTYGVGQVVGREPTLMNCVVIALFQNLLVEPECDSSVANTSNLCALLYATRDLLDSGRWKVVAVAPTVVARSEFPFEGLRAIGWVGAKVFGSANVEKFLNAFHRLAPWNGMADPLCFDKMLLGPQCKPHDLLYK